MTEVKPSLFQELKRYSLNEIRDRLGCTPENVKAYINTLRKYGIVKIVKKDSLDFADLTNDDLVIADSAEEVSGASYKFDFVGIVAVKDKVVFCYPKYTTYSDKEKILEELKLAIKAIRKYDSKGELVHLHNRDDKGEYNKLALSLHILQDYFENGVYTNIQEIIETNGDGEIDWDRTINETFAYIKDNRPYYLELKTRSSQNDDFDYFKRLHECIVTQCSKYLKKLAILDFFDMAEVLLSELDLKDFGDTDYILYRLEREIANQYITRKQNLLKTLYTFVATSGTSSQENSYSLYGTNCMNLVWEKACGQIFGNEYETLKRHIPKPLWELDGNFDKNVETLIPDIVTRYNYPDGSELFYILDGKYYLPRITNNKISGNPGVQDVVKQFVYHKAFLDYIFNQYHCTVFNAFLFPMLSDSDETENIKLRGHVTMMDWGVETLVPLYLLFLRPSFVWGAYIKGKSCKDELNKVRSEVQFQDVFSGILDTSQTLQRKSKENVDNQLTMVGYLKQPYFNFIADALLKPESFLFYFYRTKDGFKYPIHPDLKHCQKFIGYTDDGRIIRGDISKNISVMKAEKLQIELGKNGFSGSAHSAEDYIVVEICNYKIDDSISVSELKESINAYKGNDATNAHSPKVIDVIN